MARAPVNLSASTDDVARLDALVAASPLPTTRSAVALAALRLGLAGLEGRTPVPAPPRFGRRVSAAEAAALEVDDTGDGYDGIRARNARTLAASEAADRAAGRG